MIGRLLGFAILCASLLGGWVWMEYRNFIETPLNVPEDRPIYEVPKGASLARIARDMQAAGLIDNARYLEWYGRYTGQASKIRAGEYRLETGMSPDELLGLLVSGKPVTYSLTLVEGWNIRQVRAALAAHPAIRQTLGELGNDRLMEKLGRPGEHPEGRFFPDTYHFNRGLTDEQFLRRAMAKMDEELNAAWEARAESVPLQSAYDALILASIVEKETGKASERREIAGVFARRLDKNMKLQTDPTVIYGMGENFDGNIRRRDLREDTPYNTYVHKGLPPTPICMPGRGALRAAVDPLPGETLYFVATGDGAHVFSKTLKAHNAAVRRYQLKR